MPNHQPRINAPILLTLLGVIIFAGGLTKADAQLMVQMKLNNKDYIAYEAVNATVTVYNRAGQDVVLPAGVSTTDMLYNWTMIQNVSLQLANAFLPVNQSSVQIAVTPFADNPRLEIPLGHPGNERSQTAFINALRTLRYK